MEASCRRRWPGHLQVLCGEMRRQEDGLDEGGQCFVHKLNMHCVSLFIKVNCFKKNKDQWSLLNFLKV